MAYRDPITGKFTKPPEPVVDVDDYDGDIRSDSTPDWGFWRFLGLLIATGLGIAGMAELFLAAHP
jgi:hypothetical protein